MTIYTFALRKGGAGKTASAAEAALALSRTGKVLAIDLDPQRNLTTRLGLANVDGLAAVAADVLTGDATLAQAAVPSPRIPGVDVVAASEDLSALELRPEILMSLRAQLLEDAGEWENVVIDTATTPGLVTQCGLAAANEVVAPVECAGEAFLALTALDKLITDKLVKTRLRPDLQVHHIIPTRYHARGAVDAQVLGSLRATYGDRVTPVVRESAYVRQSFIAQLPVSLYRPSSPVAADYKAALDHITNGAH